MAISICMSSAFGGDPYLPVTTAGLSNMVGQKAERIVRLDI